MTRTRRTTRRPDTAELSLSRLASEEATAARAFSKWSEVKIKIGLKT